MFILVLDAVVTSAQDKIKKFHLRCRNFIPMNFLVLAFADDIVESANNDVELQYNVRILKEGLSKINMTTNPIKPKVLRISKELHKIIILYLGGFKPKSPSLLIH